MKSLFFVAATLLVVGLVIAFVRLRSARAAANRNMVANLELQTFALAKLDEVAKLLSRQDLTSAEMVARAEVVFSEMRAKDPDGQLAPLISDTQTFVREEAAKRSGS